jgi:hypothetical protein
MQLNDPKLTFARDLIGHWLNIRGDALVPFEKDIDPREFLRWIDQVGILDLTVPAQVVFEVAGSGVMRRFGRDLRRMNWVDLVPPILGDAGQRAREHVRSVPCGYYHRFTVLRDRTTAFTAETLALPLYSYVANFPKTAIAITHDDSRDDDYQPLGWLSSLAHMVGLSNELVDIGAGVPGEG